MLTLGRQILGLFTVLVGLAAGGLHLVVKVRAPPAGTRLSIVRMAVNQLFLTLVIATTLTGLGEVDTVSFGLLHAIPFGLAVSIGFGLSTAILFGTMVSGLEIFITCRQSFQSRKAYDPASVVRSEKFIEAGGLDGEELAAETIPLPVATMTRDGKWTLEEPGIVQGRD